MGKYTHVSVAEENIMRRMHQEGGWGGDAGGFMGEDIKSSQGTWKMLEDVGRRCWKMWGSLAKSLGRRDFDLKKKKSFFSLV